MAAALAGGATIITANRRLSRSLHRDYSLLRLRSGHTHWPAPRILPFSGWLASLWRDALYAGAPDTPLLLDSWQERLIWLSAISSSPEAEHLLQLDATAVSARRAFQLAHRYRLPFQRSHFQAGQDTAAFFQWTRDYTARCRRLNATESARLPDFIRDRFLDKTLAAPRQLWLAGFDAWTPQQESLLKAIELAGCDVVESQFLDLPSGNATLRRCTTPEAEFYAAAQWARDILLRNPAARVGIIVQGPIPERPFAEILGSAFHISFAHGRSQAALRILETALHLLPLETVTSILLSPYVKGAATELSQRAQLDARLRRKGGRHWPLSALMQESCPILSGLIRQCQPAPASQPPSQWSRFFSARLDSFGFPAEPPISDALAQLARLDIVHPPLSCAGALSLLRRIARDTPFQPEDLGQPVQVMTVREAAGSHFDHAWIAGLHQDAWPSPPDPNPFLPIALQAAHKLPGATPSSQLDHAARLTRRLLACAGEVVVSYPESGAEHPLKPSPLIAHLPLHPDGAARPRPWYLVPAPLESLTDELAPAFNPGAVSGGSATLKLQAACPFRAFAEIRLHARPLEAPDPGIDLRRRGQLVHKVLEHFWSRMQSRQRLLASSQDQLDEAISSSIDAAFQDVRLPSGPLHSRLASIERDRLQGLLASWLRLEAERAPFTVLATEQRRDIALAGLRFTTRADRIDQLPDGRRILIDYKTTAPSPTAWEGPRPDEPQLPLYSLGDPAPLAALTFAQVGAGKLRFIPGVDARHDVARLQASWREILHNLAAQFLVGDARVDPKSEDTCKLCHLHSLCRIND
jgi:ATP-dependent helicase/nuclease subunit B